MELGEAVRRVRGTLGQVELAERMRDPKVDQSRISKWERGVGAPSLDQMRKIEDVVGATRGSILRLAGYVEDATDAREAIEADPNLLPNYKTIVLESYDTCLRLSIAERDDSGRSTSPKKRARDTR